MLSPIINLVQETIGSSRRAPEVAETGVFRYSGWYVIVKALLAAVVGVFVLGLAVPSARSFIERLVMIAVGVTFLVDARSIAVGLRKVTIEGGLVRLERAGGRQSTWPLQDLFVREAGVAMSRRWSPIVVRERRTGTVAFSIPRDLPAWEVLVATLPSVEAA